MQIKTGKRKLHITTMEVTMHTGFSIDFLDYTDAHYTALLRMTSLQ